MQGAGDQMRPGITVVTQFKGEIQLGKRRNASIFRRSGRMSTQRYIQSNTRKRTQNPRNNWRQIAPE